MDEQQHLCPSCGMPNAPDAVLCATCGRPLVAAQPEHPAQSAASPAAEHAAMLPPPPEQAQPAPPPAAVPPPLAYPPPPVAAPPPMAYPPPPSGYPMPMAPVPFPAGQPTLSSGQKTGQFFGGLGLGLAGFAAIVLLTILANAVFFGLFGGNGTNVTPFIPIVLFLAFIGVMAYLLAKPRTRWLGYGLLAAIVALPVIAVVGCIVILTAASRTG